MLAVVAAISFVAFVIWELTDANPVVDLRIFRFRGFSFSTLAISLGSGAFFSQVVLSPLWLQQVAGYTATDTGSFVALLGVFSVLLPPGAGGRRQSVVWGSRVYRRVTLGGCRSIARNNIQCYIR